MNCFLAWWLLADTPWSAHPSHGGHSCSGLCMVPDTLIYSTYDIIILYLCDTFSAIFYYFFNWHLWVRKGGWNNTMGCGFIFCLYHLIMWPWSISSAYMILQRFHGEIFGTCLWKTAVYQMLCVLAISYILYPQLSKFREAGTVTPFHSTGKLQSSDYA